MKYHSRFALLLFALATLICAGYAAADAGSEAGKDNSVDASVDPKVIAQKTLDAMGGAQAWQGTRFIRFEFFGFRLHHWDRYTGRHRLEGKTRDGDAYVVLLNLNSREGKAWLNGEAVSGEALDPWLERAWSAWINDTYWLLMPYKLMDPGVHLTHEGEDTFDGQTYDKLKLTFEQVGLTPGDTYWAWINRDTGLMDQWAYVLQDWEAGRAPTVWKWSDWQRHGNIMLSSKRFDPEKERETELDKIAVLDHLPDSVFESPDAPETAQTDDDETQD